MKKFIFYTNQGYTISPNDTDLDSLQILGLENGDTHKKAFENLLHNNKWITDCAFDHDKIEYYQIITDDLKPHTKTKSKPQI